jgi:hypothetical protein
MRRLLALLALALLAGCGPRLEPLPKPEHYPTAFEARLAIMKAGLVDIAVMGTGSMEPLIPRHPDGRAVITAYVGLTATPFSDLRPGHLVAYRQFGELTIHRLGEQDSRGFVAFGTANRRSDAGMVTPANYVGKVAKVALYPL